LEQVYLNLLDNALRFTRRNGTVRVTVRKEGDNAVLSVSDNGRGIAPDMLSKVFDLFVQGEQSIDRSHGGLGLGLALVRRLAELHGGSVTAESGGVGRGSTFNVAIPAIPAPHELPRKWPVTREASVEPLRILVIEDNQDARQMLRAMLTMGGHEVREAADGESGIAAALETTPEVVLLDIGLPDMDGYEVARRLRTVPGGYSMVLVALSGYGRDDDRGRAREASFDAHVVKPAGPEQLGQIIAELVAARNGVTAK
jgi:two-component system, sensor histidine kinase